MTIDPHKLTVGGVEVAVVRKAIKNLHLGVYPPNGRVRVATPLAVSDEAVRLAVVGKLGWIKRQRERFVAQPRQSRREMVSGESHYFQGRRYRLHVIKGVGPPKVVRRNNSTLELHVRPQTTVEQRQRILQQWYRQHLRALIPSLLELAKKPASCLEYIIVHELTHLLERNHTERFKAIMDRHLPTWRMSRRELNSEPLANESWRYC